VEQSNELHQRHRAVAIIGSVEGKVGYRKIRVLLTRSLERQSLLGLPVVPGRGVWSCARGAVGDAAQRHSAGSGEDRQEPRGHAALGIRWPASPTCRESGAVLQGHHSPVLRLQPARGQDFRRHPAQRSRTRCRDCRSSWSSLLIGTKRIFGRPVASAIASASM